jgi:superfamily I DNA and/or RNA helicase
MDEVGECLLKLWDGDGLEDLCRIGRGTTSRVIEEIAIDEDEDVDAKKARVARAKVIFATLSGRGSARLKSKKIGLVIIDECGFATDASTLIPPSLISPRGGRLVLVGDE